MDSKLESITIQNIDMLTKKGKAHYVTPHFSDLVPVKEVHWEHNQNNLVVLLIPRFRNHFLAKHLMPKLKRPNIKINLDEIGSWIWLRIDGKSPVSEIEKGLQNTFGEKVEPVNERLKTFLNSLARNKFITLYAHNCGCCTTTRQS